MYPNRALVAINLDIKHIDPEITESPNSVKKMKKFKILASPKNSDFVDTVTASPREYTQTQHSRTQTPTSVAGMRQTLNFSAAAIMT